MNEESAGQQFVTQAEFARMQGCVKSHITALKHAGRLVFNDQGRVDVAASRARIAETADPNRDDVAARHAAARNLAVNAPAEQKPSDPPETPEDESIGPKGYQAARAEKERYAALTAKMEYEKAIGKLVDRAAAEAAFFDAFALIAQGLDQQAFRMAPELVGKDIDAIRATIRQENNALKEEAVAEFGKRMKALVGEDQ